ncbi:hypothetical protein P8C59_004787 [Phyllachora maydis]|uniref:N-acetyltransferase domain-containing protein n=1 Tax=Phyllachora maydis TaxID=1825666 RepID=A0AAD9MBM6_9PEZI|nr:hypothetical protein P8C59_004787 [Phyllachora maydis]
MIRQHGCMCYLQPGQAHRSDQPSKRATAAAANFTTYNFTTEAHGHLTPFFAALQASCITADQMAQGPFLPPLTNEKLLPWWRARMAEARAGQRVIVLLLPDLLGPTAQKPQGADFRGIAMMSLSPSETGTARCHIDCLLVDRKYRRQGGAKALVQALEYEAGKRGRTLLLVDTEADTLAEAAFKKFGYTEVGKVPRYNRAVSNLRTAQTFFYKDLLP